MATYRVELTKVHCRKRTAGIGKDEIYLGLFPALVKQDENGTSMKRLQGILSRVQKNVDEKTRPYVPTLISGTNWIEVEVTDPKVVSLVFSLALYEQDDGKIYEEMLKSDKLTDATRPKTLDDIGPILVEKMPDDPTSIMGWVKFAFGAIREVIKLVGADDLVNVAHVPIVMRDEPSLGPREYTITGHGGAYVLGLNVTKKD